MHQNGPTVISWINCGGKHLEFGVGKIYLKVKCVWVFFYLELSMGATRVGNVAGMLANPCTAGPLPSPGASDPSPGGRLAYLCPPLAH